MKTTIEIPEALYRQAKIRAVESGQTLRQVVLNSLERELAIAAEPSLPKTLDERRKLRSDFVKLQKAGAFAPKDSDRDITELISDDRDGR